MSIHEQAEKHYNAVEFLKIIDEESKKPGNENKQYELINGRIYMMSSPLTEHGYLSRFIFRIFDAYFMNRNCEVLNTQHDVYLFDKRLFPFTASKKKCTNVYVPDLLVICDKNKIRKDGIYGAPDLVIEIVSQSSIMKDYKEKMNNYLDFGVKEYWIVNPMTRKIMLYVKSGKDDLSVFNYTFDEIVNSEIFSGLCVDFKQFADVP